MIVTQAINVHLDKRTTPTIEAVQSDTGRAVTVALFNQGSPWEPPADATATVRHSIWQDGELYTSAYDTLSNGALAVDFSGNVLTIFLSAEILSIPGVGELQVGILHKGVLIATMSVLLRVQRNIGTQGLTPTAYTDLSHHIHNELVRQFQDIYDQGSWVEHLHPREKLDFSIHPEHNYLLTSDFISHGGREVQVSFPAGVKVRCLFYNHNFECTAETAFYTQSFSRYHSAPYLQLEACYEDEGRIQNPIELAEQIGVFYRDGFQGCISALDCHAFHQCDREGYYQFTATDVATLSDAPDIHAGGILEVKTHADTNAVFQTLWTGDGEIWFRTNTEPFRKISSSGVFTVSVSKDGTADKSWDEIQQAYHAGRTLVCAMNDMLMPLQMMENAAHFGCVWSGVEYHVEIADADDVSVTVTELAGSGSGLTQQQIDALDGMFRIAAYTADASAQYAAFRRAFGLEGDIPDVPDHTHSYTSVVTNATCDADGKQVHTCTCGHSYTTVLPALGHNYVSGVCTRCGKAEQSNITYITPPCTFPTGNIANGYIGDGGVITARDESYIANTFVKVNGGSTYRIDGTELYNVIAFNVMVRYTWYDSNGSFIARSNANLNTSTKTATITAPGTAAYIVLSMQYTGFTADKVEDSFDKVTFSEVNA